MQGGHLRVVPDDEIQDHEALRMRRRRGLGPITITCLLLPLLNYILLNLTCYYFYYYYYYYCYYYYLLLL